MRYEDNDFVFVEVEGWSKPEEYYGPVSGCVCGYGFEVKRADGHVGFRSCVFDYGTPADVANDEFEQWMMENNGFEYTGHVYFHGYFEKHWDWEERDDYYIKIEDVFGDHKPIPYWDGV